MKISLFSRNGIQNPFFEGVGDYLKQFGADISLIYPRAGKATKLSFFPESEISDLILEDEIDFKAEFQRICITYNNVNRIIQSEREINYFPHYFRDNAVTRDEKLKLCCATFICFERYIAEFDPDIIVSEMVVGMLDGVLFEVAKLYGIPYLGIRASKLNAGVIFCDNPYDRPVFFDETMKALKSESKIDLNNEALQIIRASLKSSKTPHYMELSSKKFKIFSLNKIKSAFRILFFSKELPKVSIYQHNRLNTFREKIIKMRNIRGWNFDDKEISSACSNYKYFVYATHFEPEASVQVRSFYFSDQIALIKQISRLLPPDCLLIVKEHRGNEGYRNPTFYEDLSHSYNVFCASPDTNLRDLIRKSRGVITLTGRVGIEALIDKIPVIAFGQTFWSNLPDVKRPRSPEEIKSVLSLLAKESSSLDRGQVTTGISKELACLVVAYDRMTYDGNFIHGSKCFTTQKNLESIARAIQGIHKKIVQPSLPAMESGARAGSPR